MSKNEFIEKDQLDALRATEEKKSSRKKSARKEKSANNYGRVIVQIMNGEFLSKENFIANLPFTFYVGFLMVIMISWGYYAETVTRREVSLERELGEVNAEFFTLGSEYNTQRGRRSVARIFRS